MYLRISKARQKSYLVLVEGYREGDKVKQRTICNLGAIDDKMSKKALSLGRNLLGKFGADAIIDGSEFVEDSRSNWGAYELISHLWQRYRLEEFWQNKLSNRKLEYDLENILQAMLAGRLSNPSSKLALYENQEFYDGFARYELHNLYKSLDELDRYKDELSQHLFKTQQTIHGRVNIAFFDVTTMYFESKKVDELKRFGFSKDCKFNDVQIVLSLLTDQAGNPLAYELFPGNMSEGKTLDTQLLRLKEKYQIKEAVIVADRGMYSDSNLAQLSALGFKYIVGTKLRNMSKKIKDKVFDEEGYHHSQDGTLSYKTIDNEERKTYKENIIITWSKKRSDKDRSDRIRLVEKSAKLLASGNVQDKRGWQEIY